MCEKGWRKLAALLSRPRPSRILDSPESIIYRVTVREPLELSLSRSSQSRILGLPECENLCEVTGDHLQHCFSDLAQVAFWTVQKFYALLLPLNRLNYGFLDLVKVVFWDSQKAKIEGVLTPVSKFLQFGGL